MICAALQSELVVSSVSDSLKVCEEQSLSYFSLMNQPWSQAADLSLSLVRAVTEQLWLGREPLALWPQPGHGVVSER